MHKKNMIHRDLKPDNFLMGMGKNSSTVYLIDFGLAKHYYDATTKLHIPFLTKKSLTGTARYASSNAHRGYELSRRDDLISLGYMMIYFLKGSLPWQSIFVDQHSNNCTKILESKQKTSLEELCQGCPLEFKLYMKHCESLTFEQTPDYGYLKILLRNMAKREDIDLQGKAFDWNIIMAKSLVNAIPGNRIMYKSIFTGKVINTRKVRITSVLPKNIYDKMIRRLQESSRALRFNSLNENTRKRELRDTGYKMAIADAALQVHFSGYADVIAMLKTIFDRERKR